MATGVANITMPFFTLDAPVLTGSVTFPLFSSNTLATAGTVTFPLFTVTGGVAYANGAIEFPLFTTTTSSVTGRSATANLRMPLFRANSTGEAGGIGDADFPLFTLRATGGPLPDIDGTAIIPLFDLIAAGYVPPVLTDASAIWVVNVETKAHTTYSNFEVLGMGEFGGSYFALTEDGIFELTGSDDDGTTIDWEIYWPPTDGGTSTQKSMDAAYLNFRVDGHVKFVSITDEINKRIHNKNLADSPQGLHRRRVSGTRGLRGQMWQCGVENLGDNDVTLMDVEVRFIKLKRRLK